jgi:hemoglobin/transferrin/lactoferrin receptor protein
LKAAVRLSAATGLKFAFGQTRGTDTAAGKPLNSVNPAKWVVGVDHKLGDWTLGATLTHVAAKSAKDIHNTLTVPNTPFATPAYTTLDLKAVWQLKRGSKLSVALHNVTNKTYWDWTNVRGLASNSPVLDAYTAPGRSISVAWATDF